MKNYSIYENDSQNFYKDIIACTIGRDSNTAFSINIPKLRNRMSNYGLFPIICDPKAHSHYVYEKDLTLLEKFFPGDEMNWFADKSSLISFNLFFTEDIDDTMDDITSEVVEYQRAISINESNKFGKNVKSTDDNCDCNKARFVDIKSTMIKAITTYKHINVVIAKKVQDDSDAIKIIYNVRFKSVDPNGCTCEENDADNETATDGDSPVDDEI